MHGALELGTWYPDDFGTRQIPMTTMNLLSGGKQTANNLDFRKFMIASVGTVSLAEARHMCNEVYQTMKNILQSLGRSTHIGEEGGFMPNLVSNEEALAVIMVAIQKAGYKPGEEIGLIIDVSASEFFENGEYNFSGEGFIKTPLELVEYYTRLVDEYPILSIQGGMAKDDREGWILFMGRLSDKLQMSVQDTANSRDMKL